MAYTYIDALNDALTMIGGSLAENPQNTIPHTDAESVEEYEVLALALSGLAAGMIQSISETAGITAQEYLSVFQQNRTYLEEKLDAISKK